MTMKLAVLSDIHGNLIAFEAALKDLESVGAVDMLWVLGDLAAFGPRPAECMRLVRELPEKFGEDKVKVIGGNTDRYLVTGKRPEVPAQKDEESLRQIAAFWTGRDTILNWCVSALSWDDYEFLAKIIGKETALTVKDYGTVIGYHAIPGDDEPILSPDTSEEEALDHLLDREGRLGIGGHIHVQMDRNLGRWRAINVGSVGMSFDMRGKAQWGLFTFENGAIDVDLRAVPYDIEAAAADARASNHPFPDDVINRIVPKD
jgi:predicted phosphodiesterase